MVRICADERGGRMEPRPRRLSPLDVSNLRVEDRGRPMHVAGLAILEGAPLLDASGELRLSALLEHLERRLHLAPALRQVLYRPRLGLGPPVWVDDPGFDIRRHVRARAVPAPGDEEALLRVCSELNEPPLDRSRPLWELWLLTGLAGGEVGVLIRLHHVVADGIAALALMGALFDASADAAPPVGRPWTPRPVPGARELLGDNLRHRAVAVTRAVSRLRRPAQLVRRLGSTALQVRQLLHEGLAPRVSLNRPVGRRRRLLLGRADLDRVRALAHAHGAKVNDVVLAAVAGGARRLLEHRGELRRDLVLKASVAVSMRRPADQQAAGNVVGIRLAPLPAGDPDPIRRLRAIARATAEGKRRPPLEPGGRFARTWMVQAMSSQRLVNLFTSNLPGPPVRLYLAGARVLELFQVGVVQGNVTVGVGVLSYAGRLNFAIVGDAEAVPDLEVFAEGLSEALEELGSEVRGPSSPPAADRRPGAPSAR
ncbi:MAG TPA: wax ester/triacylglycerol synthase family O-acyltransferase [Actinomycetota bacterium]|nr:wax ester/triacylglycerol synthase family O-acyltransferase [Actinomycetota bacterium]